MASTDFFGGDDRGMFFGFRLHQETGRAKGFFKNDKKTSLQEALDLIQGPIR